MPYTIDKLSKQTILTGEIVMKHETIVNLIDAYELGREDRRKGKDTRHNTLALQDAYRIGWFREEGKLSATGGNNNESQV